jgi:hypothetical protein
MCASDGLPSMLRSWMRVLVRSHPEYEDAVASLAEWRAWFLQDMK